MKVRVIYNPAAGGGRDRVLQRVVVALERRGVAAEVYRTRGPGDATQWLRQQSHDGIDMVIAVGGDGTTNEVINGLPSDLPLGVFATGTANVLAQELALPADPEQAAAVIAEGRNLLVWPGRLNERRFVMMAGIGYDAWVVEGVNLAIKQRFGKLAYVLSMLANIGRYGRQRFQVMVDGQVESCYSLVVTNGRCYGGSFILSPQARIDAPRFQVLMFQAPGVRALLATLLRLPFGRMETAPGVVSVPATRVEVRADGDEPVQTDGDLAGRLPALLEVDTVPVPVRVSAAVWQRYQSPVSEPPLQ